MPAFIDITNQKYGQLTAIKRVGTKSGCALWQCVCDCGTITEIPVRSLRCGNTKSCGCVHSSLISARNKANAKHNGEGERLYGVWHAMKQRCTDPNRKDYENYGGRGIKVCDEWANDYAIFREWSLQNGYDENASYGQCTLDRIDPNGHYCQDNCRWTDAKLQANNRRRSKKGGEPYGYC